MRNAVHDRLSDAHGQHWLRNPQVLQQNELRRVNKARAQLKRERKRPAPGRVVAELGFGFWLSLFAKRYDTLWNTELNRLFSPTPTRRDLYDELVSLRDLRNRIAHHEPIHQLPLSDCHNSILRVLGMLSPVAASWVSGHSQVPEILADSVQ